MTLFCSIGLTQEAYINKLSNYIDRAPIVSQELRDLTPIAYQSHPEFGILPYDAPCKDCYELIHERTDSTRKFNIKNTNGNQFAIQTALGVLNYKAADNQYYEYNKKLKKSTALKYVSDNKYVISTFDIENKTTNLSVDNQTQISFNNVELIFRNTNNETINFGFANWSNYTVGEDGVKIIDAWPHVDIEMVNTFHGIKTNYIIKENLNLGIGQLLFIDNYGLPTHYHLEYLEPSNPFGQVVILNQNDITLFEISEAYGFDGIPNNENFIHFNYEINENTLAVVVESSFLNNTYPLTIDPNVSSTNSLAQASITGSMFSAACNFTGSCDYLLNVNSPANTAISNVTFSFSYFATGTCLLIDGAMRIFYNGCVSPPGAIQYYTCTNPGAGPCNGLNIPLFTHLSPCIPAPSCVPFNMPITLGFFRSCKGAVGCSNTCIQSNSPFSVTVFGTNLQTLFNGTTGNGNMSLSPATCSGTSLLNPFPAAGIPGYTYAWSTGATTPTTTVLSSGTSPITCTVTDACGVSRVATFTIICPLGVEYQFITANKIGNRTVELSWETIEESDNDYFTVLRSHDGINFEEVGVLQSKGIGSFNYNFTDNNNTSSSIVYYRLRNTSLSGDVEYSEIFKVDFENNELDIVIVPNPSNGEFAVNYNVPYTDEYLIHIVDALGRFVVSKSQVLEKGNTLIPFDLSTYNKGIFTISITNKTSNSKQRIIIL